MKRAAAVVLLMLSLVAPLAAGEVFYINVASQILIAAVFAASLNILVGYGGLVSLGHASFFGLAAYAVALLTTRWDYGHVTAILFALVFSTMVAGVFGAMSLRATGITFLMITLALGQTLWGVAYRWADLTGGDNGITDVKRPVIFGVDLIEPTAFYLAMVGVLLATMAFLNVFVHSGLGMSLEGARDQPRRMRMLGHNVRMVQWLAFVIAGFLAAVSGICYVYYHSYIHPHSLGLATSAEALLMVIAGGVATLAGPLVGAVIVVVFKMVVSAYVTRWVMLLGVVFVLIVIFLPEGVVPGLIRLIRRFVRQGDQNDSSARDNRIVQALRRPAGG
jgi:branched-chain amino acid transport system permease protein